MSPAGGAVPAGLVPEKAPGRFGRVPRPHRWRCHGMPHSPEACSKARRTVGDRWSAHAMSLAAVRIACPASFEHMAQRQW